MSLGSRNGRVWFREGDTLGISLVGEFVSSQYTWVWVIEEVRSRSLWRSWGLEGAGGMLGFPRLMVIRSSRVFVSSDRLCEWKTGRVGAMVKQPWSMMSSRSGEWGNRSLVL